VNLDLDEFARRLGVDALRPFQREAASALLADPARVLLVAPTGGGKSLCYQLPALALGGTALVLSPLISLMQDQVRALAARGVPATYLASTLPREENARRLAAIRRGEIRLVYAAPERLSAPGFLPTMAGSDLSLVVVDEAHCIVQWGHSYRPEYLRIGEALDELQPARVMACTATATPEDRAEIVRRLGWEGAPFTLVLRGFARPNLHLAVRPVKGPREAHQLAARALAVCLYSAAAPDGAGIVYTATRRGAEILAGRLREQGFAASAYHAGLEPAERARIAEAFASRELPVVVATSAFGMGIDRPDVRVVVHAQPPPSIEAYYQEVGRAGRDGAPARGLMLLSGADIALRRRLAALGEAGAPAGAAEAELAWDRFRALLRYVDAATCRHDFILRHFGDDAESLGGCGHCDVCLAGADPGAASADRDAVQRALAGVARARGAAGLGAIAAMLAGETSARVARAGLDRLSTFGLLAERGHEGALAVLRALLANGWIDLTDGDFPVPRVTAEGRRVLRGEVEVRVHLRAAPARAAVPERPRARRERPSPVPEAVARGMDPGLFEALRAFRAALARARACPPYLIAPDRTLTEIALVRPRSVADLTHCHGMGPARIAAYGEGLCAVVRAHGEPG
jgi:ATP-dependent DNA helicase RecQ